MKFLTKKFKSILSCTSRVAVILTLLGIVLSPFGQILSTNTAHAQSTGRKCVSTGPFVDKNDPKNWVDAKPDGTCVNLIQEVVPATITEAAARKAIEDSRVAEAKKAEEARIAAGGTSNGGSGGGDFGCSASGFTSSEGFAICVGALVYYIGPGLASNVAYVAAYFFSYTISLSLNSVAYALDFLSSGWTTVRDLANMAFILILVYIAFMIMFQAETTGTIRMLAWVIFIALIINFSFFLTRVVIDAGNILSVQFYNAIPQTATLNGTAGLGGFGGSGVKDLSASVMDAVGIQSLFTKETFAQARSSAGGSIMGGLIVLTLVYLSVAVMFWILFFVFLQVGIKFLFRVVVLWFIIISAPLALVAKAVPRESVQKYYDMWQSYLIKFSFYPAIFLFIYLIMVKFIQQMLAGQSGNLVSTLFSGQAAQSGAAAAGQVVNLNLAGAIATVSIRMGFIVAMFYIALKASDWIVSEGSNAAANITGRLTGAALGTAAFAGRVGLGGVVGGTIARQPGLANSKYAAARGLWNVGRFLNTSTYDARNAPGVSRTLGTLGGDLVKSRTMDVGKGATQTARDLEKKVELFSDKLRAGRVPSETAEKDRKELNDRVTDIKKREEIKKLVKVEENWAENEKMLKALQDNKKNGIKLDPPAQDRLAQLEKASKDRDALIKNARTYNPEKLAALGTKDLKAVMQHLTDTQRKAIENNNKIAPHVKEDLKKQWHETAKEAPLVKSHKELEELGKIHDQLASIGVSLSKMGNLGKYSKPTSTVEITEDVAKSIKKETENLKKENEEVRKDAAEKRKEHRESINRLNENIEELKDLKDDMRRSLSDRQTDETKLETNRKLLDDAKHKLAIEQEAFQKSSKIIEKLDEAIKRSDTLASSAKDVPGGIGGHKDEGTFTRTA